MPKHRINVQIKRGLEAGLDRIWLRKVISSVLEFEKTREPVEIDCVLTDNPTVQKLNSLYRGIDSPTDVLSFALSETKTAGARVIFPTEPGAITHLGEIVISYPMAVHQARYLGHSIEEEIRLLIIHGTLHLLGYDHQKDGDARRMRAREMVIVKRIEGGVIQESTGPQ